MGLEEESKDGEGVKEEGVGEGRVRIIGFPKTGDISIFCVWVLGREGYVSI